MNELGGICRIRKPRKDVYESIYALKKREEVYSRVEIKT